MNRHRAIALVMGAILWTGAAMPALGAESGSVTAQVTVATPCIIVTPSTLDFGTHGFSTYPGSIRGSGQSVHVQNCGVMGEHLYGRATHATANGTTIWSLSTTPPCLGGLDEYGLEAIKVGTSEPAIVLSTTDELLEEVAMGAAALTNNVLLMMPCVGSQGAGAVVTFDVIFTATF